jgi:RNA polymerase primary sigma factor
MNDDPRPSQAKPVQRRHAPRATCARHGLRLAPRLSAPSAQSAQRGQAVTGEQLGASYLHELDRTARITRQQEALLTLRIDQGDGDALIQLVAAHGWLVSHFARRYGGLGLDLLDLVQEGHIGLMRAAQGYDRSLGYRFATYASWWVRQAMGRAITNQGHAVRLPIHLRHAQRRLRRVQSQFEQLHGRRPEPEELAQRTGMTADVLEALQTVLRFPLSLETPVWEDDSSRLEEHIVDDSSPDPEQEAVLENLRAEVGQALATLTEREQQILRLRFGVGRRAGQSLQQVGEAFHLTRERIRQIEHCALGKLRRGAHGRRLRSFTASNPKATPRNRGTTD